MLVQCFSTFYRLRNTNKFSDDSGNTTINKHRDGLTRNLHEIIQNLTFYDSGKQPVRVRLLELLELLELGC